MLTRRRRRLLWAGPLAAPAVVLAAGAASAAWLTSDAGAGSARAASLPVPSVTAACTSASSIDVSWTTSDSAPLVSTFVVQQTQDGGVTWTVLLSTPAVIGTTSYTHPVTGLAAGTYAYRVQATNSSWLTSGTSTSRIVKAAVTTGPKANRTPASCT